MEVSVVIPVYNEEQYIENCLKSLKAQTEPPKEIIIVDNNCTDNTILIAKRYGARIVKEKRQGITHARNTGFNASRFEIIARCDADAVLSKDWIKKIKKNFRQRKIDALIGPLVFYDLPVRTILAVKTYIWIMTKILRHYPLNGPNLAIAQSMWKKIKDKVCLDDQQIHEDIDLSIHINNAGGIVGYDSSFVVSISGRRVRHNPRSFFIEYPFRLVRMIKAHNVI